MLKLPFKVCREYDAFIEDLDRYEIYNRDEGQCGLCGKSVDINDFHLDHIIPLSRGGTHESRNVQIAHAFCNQSKGAKC